jgi:hypothetical protein
MSGGSRGKAIRGAPVIQRSRAPPPPPPAAPLWPLWPPLPSLQNLQGSLMALCDAQAARTGGGGEAAAAAPPVPIYITANDLSLLYAVRLPGIRARSPQLARACCFLAAALPACPAAPPPRAPRGRAAAGLLPRQCCVQLFESCWLCRSPVSCRAVGAMCACRPHVPHDLSTISGPPQSAWPGLPCCSSFANGPGT